METLAYRVTCTTLTELLGSQPTVDVATEHIARRNGFRIPEDEAALLPEALERGTSVFYRQDGKPVLMDYQIRGFLKAAAQALNGELVGRSGKPLRGLRAKVERKVFVFPRIIPLVLPEGAAVGYLERPLRAQRGQREVVTVVRSEMLPAGVAFEFYVEVLPGEITQEVLEALLGYGYYQGLLQWRSGGYGRFWYVLSVE